MSEHALQWLEEHAEQAKAADSFEEFCTSVGTELAEHYSKYTWLPGYWANLKYHGAVLGRALMLPRVRKMSEIIGHAVLCEQKSRGPRCGTYYDAPAGYIYAGGMRGDVAYRGHMGGERSYDPVRDVRSHHGGKWTVTYVKPLFELPTFADLRATRGRNVVYSPSETLEFIDREDGVLVIARSPSGIGSGEWIALLDKGETVYPFYDADDSARIEADRKAEREAFGATAS